MSCISFCVPILGKSINNSKKLRLNWFYALVYPVEIYIDLHHVHIMLSWIHDKTVQNVTQYFMESWHHILLSVLMHSWHRISKFAPFYCRMRSAFRPNCWMITSFCARKWKIIGKYFEETYGSELENIWSGIPFSKWRNARIHDFRKGFIFSGNRTSVTTRSNAVHCF